jgi:hypothetical protein
MEQEKKKKLRQTSFLVTLDNSFWIDLEVAPSTDRKEINKLCRLAAIDKIRNFVREAPDGSINIQIIDLEQGPDD